MVNQCRLVSGIFELSIDDLTQRRRAAEIFALRLGGFA
jgi:hypothetical protein